ncbi:MAG: ParB/RepB/Spo0J family partition protein [Acidobacteriia bacterium]|nr:ParB/RepB/Spo0J family partition protein [Terriglobia bacterium]
MAKKTGLPSQVKMRHDVHYVDQLSLLSGASVGRMIPIEQIQPNPEQPRQLLGDLGDLTASILDKGILEPILVRGISNSNMFMIISGERRYRAGLNAGLKEIPCIEKDVDDSEVAEIALVENLQRKDLTAFEEAEAIQLLLDRFSYTHDQVAKKIGKARSSVTETLSISSIPANIRETCQQLGVMSKSMLLQVVRQSSSQKMMELVRRFAQGGLSRDEARKERVEGKDQRPKNYVFQFRPPTREYSLNLRFTKSKVEKKELVSVLKSIIKALQGDSDC